MVGRASFLLLLLVHVAVLSATSIKEGLEVLPKPIPGRCPEIRYRGSDTCPSVEQQCSRHNECGSHQACCYDGCRFHCADLLPICPPFCPEPRLASEQVCGSNGQTYRSRCLMEKAACDTGTNITKYYDGHCYSKRCGNCGEQQQQQQQEEEHHDTQVCGSDRVTYNNLCDMKRTACILGEDITFESPGPCSIAVCSIQCDVIEGQLCGSDLKTYENNCDLYAHSCDDSRISLLYDGPCRIELTRKPRVCPSPERILLEKGAYCSDGCRSNSDCTEDEICCLGSCGRQCTVPLSKSSRLEGCPVFCPRKFEPVCASDGHTYPNECRLTSVHYCGANNVTIVHRGRCK